MNWEERIHLWLLCFARQAIDFAQTALFMVCVISLLSFAVSGQVIFGFLAVMIFAF